MEGSEVVVFMQGEQTFFTGNVPRANEDCVKRFALAMGTSVMAFARSTRETKRLA